MLTKLAASVRVSSTLSSKYGHFWLQKSKMATVKMQTQGFKTGVHKPMGDVTVPTSIIFYCLCCNTTLSKSKRHQKIWLQVGAGCWISIWRLDYKTGERWLECRTGVNGNQQLRVGAGCRQADRWSAEQEAGNWRSGWTSAKMAD